MATTYKVVKGDTLWGIVQKPAYKNLIAGNSIQSKVNTLVKINNISNPNLIVTGQTLKLSGSTTKAASTASKQVEITQFGVLASNDRKMYAAWKEFSDVTKEYECKWTIATKVTANDVVWKTAQTDKVTDKACFFDVPDGVAEVNFTVRALDDEGKALSGWLDPRKKHKFDVFLIEKPPAPEVSIQTDKLWASIFDAKGDFGGTVAKFLIYNVTQGKTWVTSDWIPIVAGRASWMQDTSKNPGQVFAVRCKIAESAESGAITSEWSDYSTHIVVRPGAPTITALNAVKDDQGNIGVYVEWKVNGSTSNYATLSHEIEYVAKDPSLFDTSNQAQSVTVEQGNKWTISGITIGEKYYFRVRGITTAVGGATGGDASYWSYPPVEITIGTTPDAPTTWSSSSTVISGEKINLYWNHNTMDGSSETSAILKWRTDDMIDDDGEPLYEYIEKKNESSLEDKDKTKVCEFDTNLVGYKEGAEVQWAVCTAGITGEYGPYSETRSFKIFVEPELKLDVSKLIVETYIETDEHGIPLLGEDGKYITVDQLFIKQYPISVRALNVTQDDIQNPVTYTIEIQALSQHETVNYRGETVVVAQGETVFTRHYDTNEELVTTISATDVDLTSNVEYSLICTMAMDSGLVSTAFINFIARFDEVEYPVSATILLNQDKFTAIIQPFVLDIVSFDNIRFSIFRREHDGSFMSIAENFVYTPGVGVTDMHPSLDIPRYRIVATNIVSGTISFADIIGPEFQNKPVVIQWEEDWQNYDYRDEETAQVVSCLQLPYNIDVTDTQEAEVSLVNYIGREHPVAYYGTHLNVGGTWNTVIDAEDKETIYALRRLSRWKGNVYVRSPSGIGYWANIKVSFSEKHQEVSIPVTLTVTRVEGGA